MQILDAALDCEMIYAIFHIKNVYFLVFYSPY